MKNSEVCEGFAIRQKAKTKHLFSEKEFSNNNFVLYSYGYHFPLSVLLEDGVFLINKNSYSQTTERHKRHLSRVLGFENFKDLEKNHKENIILFSTNELKEIIDRGIKTKNELTETKI